ncbi:MAG: tetratricopeptide repeat protein [Nitrospirota bacterium]
MGKVFCLSKINQKLFPFMVFMMLAAADAQAAMNEYALFDKGYNAYLSYMPEKAVEEFRTFLKEFPKSSAADAAMYWLGKSLLRLNSADEAKNVFSALQQQFPKSPFIAYAAREIAQIGRPKDPGTHGVVSADDMKKEKDIADEKLLETERQIKLMEEEILNAAEERENLRALLEGEKKQSEELRSEITGYETIISYMVNSSFVLTKLGVREVLWRTGNILDDYINENILYETARTLGISEDAKYQQDMIDTHKFTRQQAEYLARFLAISSLINTKLREMPEDITEDRVIEMLDVRYEQTDKYTKIMLSERLIKMAKSGTSFQDVHQSYPDVAKFSFRRFHELEKTIRDRIQNLGIGDIEIIWSEDGYVIAKPIVRTPDFHPDSEVLPETKKRIKALIGELLREKK